MLIVGVLCLVFGIWFARDGWFNPTYPEENSASDLWFNRIAPFPLAVVAISALIMATIIPKRRLIADEKGLTLANGSTIAYQNMVAIDKRRFEQDGHITIKYQVGGADKSVKLSDRKYDNLGQVLDEVVNQTGAAPAKPDADTSDAQPS